MSNNCRIGRTYAKHQGVRQYAAAKVSRSTGDWMPVQQSVNDLIRSSSPIMRSRIRQLVRDFPYFTRAVDILVGYTVGTGTNFQSRVLNPKWTPGSTEKKFDRLRCQQIEDAFNWWAEEADAAGKLHFCEMEELAKREDCEAGEYLFVKVNLSDKKRFIPFALQAYEAEWLTDVGAIPLGDNPVEQGIEYDRLSGRVIAYHLTDPQGWGKTQRIPAEYVLHNFAHKRAGQLRGVSPFHAAVLIARDLNDYLDATIDTAKLAAKYLALVTTEHAEEHQGGAETDDNGNKIVSIENAIIEYLRPGEDIKFATNNNPGSTFDPFTKFILRMVAIATGTSYSLLSGDYSDSSYTTMRSERGDLRAMIAPHQNRHVLHFCSPVGRDVLDASVLRGRLDLPGYYNNPRIYQRGLWISPGQEPTDPLKESKANIGDIGSGLNSPQRIAARRGVDVEEILDELQEFYEMVAERKIPLDFASTALATNPAALDDDGTNSLKQLIARAVNSAFDERELLKEDS